MNAYSIYEGNFERLEKKLQTIEKKCAKHGCEFHFEVVGEEFKDVCVDGETCTSRFILVEVEGTAIVNGWRFVATLEHADTGNIVRQYDDSLTIPDEYYTCKATCDHCNTKRARKDTYIVFNEDTQEFKQVGKTCLREYTDGLSSEAVAQYISWFDSIIQGESIAPGTRVYEYYFVEDILRYAAECIKHYGYVRTESPGSTRDTVNMFYRHIEMNACPHMYRQWVIDEIEKTGFDANTPKNVKLAKDCMDWIHTSEENSNYMRNIRTIVESGYVSMKNWGYIVASMFTYLRYLDSEAKKDAAYKKLVERQNASKHVGNVGEKVTVNVSSYTCLTSWETQFGCTSLLEFVDDSGNVFIWKTSTYIKEGVVRLVGTVKEHGEFRGVKQTVLTRCKVEYNNRKQRSEQFVDKDTSDLLKDVLTI